MPKVTVEDIATFDVPAGKRVVNALTDECGQDQLHACGGLGRCTTCRVIFVSGEPPQMTEVERNVLAAKGLTGQSGLRLSCQLTCDADMTLKVVSRFEGSGRKDSGGRPKDEIEPPPIFVAR